MAEGQRIEADPGLRKGVFMSSRWIKPLKRAKGQRKAHLIVCFRALEDAIKAIKDSHIIVGKRVWANRMRREPKSCLKFQMLNIKHFAAAGIHVVHAEGITTWLNTQKTTR